MRKPKQIFTLTTAEMRRYSEHFRNTGQFVVIHDHREDYGCPGDCLMLNLPDDVRNELSTEI